MIQVMDENYNKPMPYTVTTTTGTQPKKFSVELDLGKSIIFIDSYHDIEEIVVLKYEGTMSKVLSTDEWQLRVQLKNGKQYYSEITDLLEARAMAEVLAEKISSAPQEYQTVWYPTNPVPWTLYQGDGKPVEWKCYTGTPTKTDETICKNKT